jgi:hypothetical protein
MRIPREEAAAAARAVFGRDSGLREVGAAPVEWLGGVLVDFQTDDGRMTMHEPDRKIFAFSRNHRSDSLPQLDMFSAAGVALSTLHSLLPWSVALRPALPEEYMDTALRMTLSDVRGPLVLPSRVDLRFMLNGELIDVWAYHEADVPLPDDFMSREEAIDRADEIAREDPSYSGCRHGEVKLRVVRKSGEFRTIWAVAYPPTPLRRSLSMFVGWGGEIELDAATAELLQSRKFK